MMPVGVNRDTKKVNQFAVMLSARSILPDRLEVSTTVLLGAARISSYLLSASAMSDLLGLSGRDERTEYRQALSSTAWQAPCACVCVCVYEGESMCMYVCERRECVHVCVCERGESVCMCACVCERRECVCVRGESVCMYVCYVRI